jgi:hypothetical protein
MRITRPLAVDVTLAAVLTLAGIVGSTFADTPHRAYAVPIDAWGYVLVVTAAVTLAARRRWQLPVLAVVTACTSVGLWASRAHIRPARTLDASTFIPRSPAATLQ